MPRRIIRNEINEEHQGLLFGAPISNGHGGEGFTTPSPEPVQFEPVTEGEPGTYVNLRDRAFYLGKALTTLGKRNQRSGFAIAVRTEPVNQTIEERYEEDLPFVVEGARRNEDRFTREAKLNFANAVGYRALRNSGLFDEELVDAWARREWSEFIGKYSGTKERAKVRAKYNTRLKKDITRANKAAKQTTKEAA
jgi:hypothetical protein